jgi:hypothetical protein
MSIETERKINQLLKSLPKGIVLLSSWLKQQGYSPSLQQRYRNSRWLDAIGSGAMIRADDQVSYEGAIYALQEQSGLSVHPGGRTALSFLGKTHYLELSSQKAVIFGSKQEKLPIWFKNHSWVKEVNYYPTSFLPPDMGLTEVEVKDFSIKVSGAARALLECLYLAPAKQELLECYELMEGLNNLRPDQVQSLLENCQSIKVKRLFVYMAEKIGHAWFEHLNLKSIDLGKGKRSIVKDGVYIPKYQITVPSELETEHGQRNI